MTAPRGEALSVRLLQAQNARTARLVGGIRQQQSAFSHPSPINASGARPLRAGRLHLRHEPAVRAETPDFRGRVNQSLGRAIVLPALQGRVVLGAGIDPKSLASRVYFLLPEGGARLQIVD
jgi:hypothetical protein